MLGALGPSRGWRFAAVGKHPAAKDYIRVGETDPLIAGFAEWVGSGYRALEVAKIPATIAIRSFRFFARGPGRDMLACGVLRDSSDAVGRPYPLLVMGCGPLKGWEDRWDLLPLACEKTWEQMEYASAGASSDVASLDARVRQLRCPEGDWAGLDARRGTGGEAEAELAERIARELARSDVAISLGDGESGDVGVASSLGYSGARSRGRGAPTAAFIGGTHERTGFFCYYRSLTPADFASLWRVGPAVREDA